VEPKARKKAAKKKTSKMRRGRRKGKENGGVATAEKALELAKGEKIVERAGGKGPQGESSKVENR